MSAPLPITRDEIVVGLDIGTTKVGTVIASGQGEGPLTILGVGVVPSRGIKRGVVVDVADTVSAIQESVERAAHMAGVRALRAVAGITGDHIESLNARGSVTVSGASGTISRLDVERVLAAAALEVPRDREIVHSLPRDFSVDGHPGVKRPVGMVGTRLEVETHIVTGRASFLQNSVQCVKKAGLAVEALVLEPIATAEAVTTADEREMGVILIDIGGGTSDIAVFLEGAIIYSGVLAVGGNHVTRDIAVGLRTPFELAEQLKLDSGAAMPNLIPHGEALEVLMAGSGERLRIPRSLLGEIIEARMSELFEITRAMMHDAGIKRRFPGGVILAGGGALLPGAVELGEAIFQMPTRLGFPRDLKGWSEQVSIPQLATGVGLCRFALKQRLAPGNQTQMAPVLSHNERKVWGGISESPQVSASSASARANEKLSPREAIFSTEATTPLTLNDGEPALKWTAPHAEAVPDLIPPPEPRPVDDTDNEPSGALPPLDASATTTDSHSPRSLPLAESYASPNEANSALQTTSPASDSISTTANHSPLPPIDRGMSPEEANDQHADSAQNAKTSVFDAITDLQNSLAHRDSAWRRAKTQATQNSTNQSSTSAESPPLDTTQKTASPRTGIAKLWGDLKLFLGFES